MEIILLLLIGGLWAVHAWKAAIHREKVDSKLWHIEHMVLGIRGETERIIRDLSETPEQKDAREQLAKVYKAMNMANAGPLPTMDMLAGKPWWPNF